MSMYYSPNCKPDIKLNLEMGSVGVAAHLLAGNLKEEATVVWWRETKEAPSHPCLLWDTGLPRNGASTSLSEGPFPSLSSRCWGGSETKGGARVVRASSPSTSIRFPLVFFLEPDVGDWCSYVSCFQGKRGHSFSVHQNTFACLYGSDESQVGGVALIALGSMGLGCVVASSMSPKQGHHMFPSTPSSVRHIITQVSIL